MRHLVSKALLVGVVAAAVAGFVTTFASAATKPGTGKPTITFVAPSPAEGGTVHAIGVIFAFTYNRTPKQTEIQTLTCSISSGTTTSSFPCDTPTPISGGSSSGASIAGITTNSYTFTVAMTLTDGGRVTATRHFTVPTFTFEENSPVAHGYELNSDWSPSVSEAPGETTAALQPAGGIVIPPTPGPSSASGCEASDFNGFVVGRVALIQRGACNFGVKVLNAMAAGASGVVIFNEGNPGRTGLIPPSQLAGADGFSITATIPVAFTTFAIGSDLLTQYNAAIQNNTDLPVLHIKI